MNGLRRLARSVANERMDKAGVRKKHKKDFFRTNWRKYVIKKGV